MSDKLPTVSYGTLCWNPRLTRQAVIGVHHQNYPPELKTHFLMYQAPFPIHFETCFPHEIKHVNVEGALWPELWALKIFHWLAQSRSEYSLLFDEDDLFGPDYTRKALEPLLAGKGFVSWNHNDVFVQRGGIWKGKYNSPIGTLCGRTRILKKAIKALMKDSPIGSKSSTIRKGPADLAYRKKISKYCEGVICTHEGVRYYFRHKGMITRKRERTADVDYGWDCFNNRANPEISKPSGPIKDWTIKDGL